MGQKVATHLSTENETKFIFNHTEQILAHVGHKFATHLSAKSNFRLIPGNEI